MPKIKKKKLKHYSRVIIRPNAIYRLVDSVQNAQKIIAILENNKLFDKSVVPTNVFNKDAKLLEHKKIFPIIYSGEYTLSMAYDVTRIALDMAIDLAKDKLYSFDLLPHNFSYFNGGWLLYDFGAFELTPKNVKTQLRSTFKISFATFELLKKLKRSEFKEYFLNRISHGYLRKMISSKSMVAWSLNLFLCMILYHLKFYKSAYRLLKYNLKKYIQHFDFKVYEFVSDEKNILDKNIIDNALKVINVNNIFCVGEKAAQWALLTENNASKFVYFNDYDICDNFYNLIYRTQRKEISTAVVYPFANDCSIPKDYSYRGLYDVFAQERFLADVVVICNFDEFYKENIFDVDDFCQNIINFARNLIILKFDKEKEANIAFAVKNNFDKIIDKIQIIENINEIFIIANVEKLPKTNKNKSFIYKNANRSLKAKEQSLKLIEIINQQV